MSKIFILTNSKSYAKFKQLKAIFFLNEQPKCQAMDYNQVKHVLKLFFVLVISRKLSILSNIVQSEDSTISDGMGSQELTMQIVFLLRIHTTYDRSALFHLLCIMIYPIGELIKRSFYVWVYKLHIEQKTLVKTIQCFQINIKVFLISFALVLLDQDEHSSKPSQHPQQKGK